MGRGYLSVRVTDGKQVCRERKTLNSQGSPERAKARESYQRSSSARLLPAGRKNLDEEGSPRSPLGFAASLVEELVLARSIFDRLLPSGRKNVGEGLEVV